MGLGFLTLGVSIHVVLCPGCMTLSDWCVVRSKDGDVQWFSERMSWLVQRRLWSEEKVLLSGPEAWLSSRRREPVPETLKEMADSCALSCCCECSFHSPCTHTVFFFLSHTLLVKSFSLPPPTPLPPLLKQQLFYLPSHCLPPCLFALQLSPATARGEERGTHFLSLLRFQYNKTSTRL